MAKLKSKTKKGNPAPKKAGPSIPTLSFENNETEGVACAVSKKHSSEQQPSSGLQIMPKYYPGKGNDMHTPPPAPVRQMTDSEELYQGKLILMNTNAHILSAVKAGYQAHWEHYQRLVKAYGEDDRNIGLMNQVLGTLRATQNYFQEHEKRLYWSIQHDQQVRTQLLVNETPIPAVPTNTVTPKSPASDEEEKKEDEPTVEAVGAIP